MSTTATKTEVRALATSVRSALRNMEAAIVADDLVAMVSLATQAASEARELAITARGHAEWEATKERIRDRPPYSPAELDEAMREHFRMLALGPPGPPPVGYPLGEYPAYGVGSLDGAQYDPDGPCTPGVYPTAAQMALGHQMAADCRAEALAAETATEREG